MLLNRLGEGAIDGPASVEAMPERIPFYPDFICPIGHTLRSALERNEPIVTHVSHLFFLCGPSAVSSGIIAVIVDAVYRVLGRWTRSHVSIEYLKLVSPFITDGDAPFTVVGKLRIILVQAAFFNVMPDAILGYFAHPMTITQIVSTLLPRHFFLQCKAAILSGLFDENSPRRRLVASTSISPSLFSSPISVPEKGQRCK